MSEGQSQPSGATGGAAAHSMRVKAPANLVVLQRDNYPTWSIRMEVYLRHAGLWEAVRPLRAGEAVECDPVLDEQARTLLIMWLSDSMLVSAIKSESARELWGNLRARHVDTSVASVLSLQRDLLSMQLTGTETLADYFARAERMHVDLQGAGENMSEHSVVLSILRGLPVGYNAAVSLLGMTTVALTFDETLRKLQFIEQDLRAKEQPSSMALLAKGKARGDGEFHCWECGETGHRKRDCPKLEEKKKPRGTGGHGAQAGGIAF
jgi:gag-polypeptide of LTR copia-type/Domain of unknown function (DUF4219)/Zinc knuckle